MIRKNEINEICKITGLKPYQQEKAYIQTIILRLIYSETRNLIYKGGTSLFMFDHLPRFSDDLDFNVNGNVNIFPIIRQISKGLETLGIHHSYKVLSKNEVSNSFQFSLEGPLYTTPISRIMIKLDFSYRELTILPTLTGTYNPIYSDLLPFDVIRMDPEEIINEKVRAIMTRNKARDVFDSYFLVKEDKLKFNKKIVTEKLGYYKLLFSMEEFESSIEKKREMWKPELQSIVLISLPDFTDARNLIMEQIKNEFGNTM